MNWRSEAISSFDVQRSMFDVRCSFFQSLLGKNNLALIGIAPYSTGYLIFSVLREIRASVIAIIQNRTITFGSAHPLSSKW